MTSRPRKFTPAYLAVVIAIGASCTSGEPLGLPDSPTSTIGETEGTSSLQVGILPEDVTELRSCLPQQYEAVSEVIGPEGGTIVVGAHSLTIPPGALAEPRTIRAEQVSGRVNSVRFGPHGLTFARPATLSLSYANCSPLVVANKVVYTDEELQMLELLPSLDDSESRTVTGEIRHFSRYAVAW